MNINRDYLIINDVKKSSITLNNGSMFFYITDKNTQNIFVNLVINVSDNELIQKYANIENAEDYTLTMNIVKPDNNCKIIEGKLHDKEKAIFEFDLKEDCVDKVGTYKCELLTKCTINDHEEITTSNKLTYKVKSSVLNDLDDIVEAPEYPLVIQLFDKLSDIEQYEEDKRANELARQLAEEQRQTRFNELNADIGNKMTDIENRIVAKEEAVDTLINDTKANIDEYKVAKDQEIDNYKATKDTEINEAIANQNTTINTQNDKISAIENNVVAQNDKLDTLETKATTHEARITAVEAKNTEQDSRLDVAENRLANIGNDITNTMQPIIDGHTARLDAIEAIDVAQNNRLDVIEVKNQQQDDRLVDIEKVNSRQDIDIKCLYGASQTIDVTKEGNSIYLQNSNNGFVAIDELKGNTLVNCNKEPNKELILNGNINTSGDNTITLTEGVDGGLVDVALEGNTMVNVCDQKDPVTITSDTNTFTLKYLYTSTNYIIQFESDTEIVIDITLGGTTLSSQNIIAGINKINITTPSELIDNNLIFNGIGFNASNIVVTEATDQDFGYFEGMKSVGECEDLEVTSSNSDATLSNTQTLTHEPLRRAGDIKDKYVLIDGKWYIERNTAIATIDDIELRVGHRFSEYSTISFVACSKKGDEHINHTGEIKCNRIKDVNSYLGIYESYKDYDYISLWVDSSAFFVGQIRGLNSLEEVNQYFIDNKIKVIYQLATPTYEPINYNPFAVYSDITHISNNSTIPCNMTIKNTGYNCLLKPSTTYTVSSNLGLNVVTTPSTLTEDCLRFMDTDTSDITTMKNVLVLEGDYTTGKPLPSHFSGIESAFEQEYDEEKGKYKVKAKVVGKNLLSSEFIKGWLNTGTGDVINASDKVATLNLVSVTPNTEYCMTKADGGRILIAEYDMDRKLIKYYTFGKVFTVSPSTYFIRVFIAESNTLTGHQLEQGNTATSYEPYKENYIEFYIDEPLRGVGDVKDKVYVKNDKVVVERNCGQREYQDGDFGTHLTDKVNTVYQLAEPTYEEVEYNDVKLFIESFKNSTLFYNSNIPVTSKLHYSYSVPLVDTVAQTADISDQQDSMIIDLATQVSVMEMMLM